MPELPFERYLVAIGLGAARTVPVAWLIPAFGGPTLPAYVRMGLGLALAVLCLPRLVTQVPTGGPIFWVLLLAREVAVGVTLGFVGALVFRAAEAAGRLTDLLRGAGSSEQTSSLGGGQSSPLGELYLLLAVVVFMEIGGLGHVAEALARSYEAVPTAPVAGAARLEGATAVVVLASVRLLEAAVALAAPALVAMLLTDIALGIVGRAAPQIPIHFVGMPLKALLGVGVVLVALGGLHAALVDGFRAWGPLLGRAVTVWR